MPTKIVKFYHVTVHVVYTEVTKGAVIFYSLNDFDLI